MTEVKEDIKKRYNDIVDQVIYYNKLYYIDNISEITDAEYDKLFQELKFIEENYGVFRKDSPTVNVGHTVSDKFSKIKHTVPMLSLDNIFTEDDIATFIQKIRRYINYTEEQSIDFIAEPKIDGVSFFVVYEGGRMSIGGTRGDGIVGEDITNNLCTITNLPRNIKNMRSDETIEVRGEIYISKDDFIKMNEQRMKLQEKIFANPRNAASGSLRHLDSSIVAARPLKYFIYGLGYVSSKRWKTHDEVLSFIQDNGFCVNDLIQVCSTTEGLIEYYRKIKA